MNEAALFAIGLVVAIPAGIVVTVLVFAAGIDERSEKRRTAGAESAEAPPR